MLLRAGQSRGVEHPVHLSMFGYDWGELPDQVLPLVSVGDPETPQMPWTILASEYQLGRSGVLPRQQKKAVGLVSRSGFPSDFILRPRTYLIKANFPTLFPRRTMAPIEGGLSVVPFEIPHTLMFDRGEVSRYVAGPGVSKDLGTQRMSGRDMVGPLLDGGGFIVDMSKTGQYTVQMKGYIEDVLGRRFEGGGVYDITIANPITFSTSCKPGTSFLVGDKYPAKINCIPPTPADVEVVVEFFPNSNPSRKRTWIARGKAGRFGHFTPHEIAPIVFDEPGEYTSRVTAKWTDQKGHLWMGQQTSVGVVAPRKPTLILHGTRSFPYGQRLNQEYNGAVKNFANRQDLTTSFMPFTPSMLPDPYAPYNPADTLFIPSNGYNESLVEPHLSMTLADYDLGRNLQEAYREPSFPLPPSHQSALGPWRYMRDVVQISTDSFAWFPADVAHADELPVIPATDGPYHPFAFPQFATVEAYTYMGVVRPGFPVMTSVYQTDAIGLYWLASPNRFGFHFNNGNNGDLSGDVYRIQAGAVLKDFTTGKNYYDAYGASISVIPSKGAATSISPPPAKGRYPFKTGANK